MTAQRQAEGFRPDLEGLRGLAILLVLGFHAVLPGFDGGFVGVDVFFVLSGFLITGLLLREHERSHTISLRNFYVRRARRILPAAAVVLVITLIASVVLLPPLIIPSVSTDAASAALSVSNYRFATQELNYFNTGVFPSPFLHYWSLSVEEQFYLVWPALLLLAMGTRWPKLGARLVLVAVLVASLAGAIWLTTVSQPWAFYSLPTRAWQLALGGLLAALSLERVGRFGGAALGVLAWAGLAAVVVGACLVINTSTPYPGVAALLPAGGAALVIAGGDRRGSPGALLAIGPMRLLGRISYSVYLVHWPLLVLPAASLAIGDQLPIGERLALCAAAVVLGWASWRFVEQPFHRGRRFSLRPSRVLALAGTAIAATAVFALAVGMNASVALNAPPDDGGPQQTDQPVAVVPTDDQLGTPIVGPDDTQPPDATPTGSASPTATGGETATPAPGSTAVPSSSPSPTAVPAPTRTPGPTPKPVPTPEIDTGSLPRNVQPQLADAPNDWERLYRDGCEESDYTRTDPLSCTYGDPHASKTVALVGDSTAGQWFPALAVIAKQQDWKIVTYIKFACRFEDIPQYTRVYQREYTECEQWIPNVVNKLKALKPDLIVVAADRSPGVMNPGDDNPEVQGQAMARLLDQVPGRIALMVTTPQMTFDPPTCLSQNRNDITACESSRTDAVGWRYMIAEKAAFRALKPRAVIVNMSDWICPGTVCPSVLNGYIVWRDYLHITATYAETLAPALEAQLPDLGP